MLSQRIKIKKRTIYISDVFISILSILSTIKTTKTENAKLLHDQMTNNSYS